MGVIRGSLLPAVSRLPLAASATIVRNLMMRNGRPRRPIRCCRKKADPRELTATANAMPSNSGDSSTSAPIATNRSNARLTILCRSRGRCWSSISRSATLGEANFVIPIGPPSFRRLIGREHVEHRICDRPAVATQEISRVRRIPVPKPERYAPDVARMVVD